MVRRLLLAAALLAGCDPHSAAPAVREQAPPAQAAPPPSAPGAAKPATLGGLTYIELTTGGALADARLPMLVALHGFGDRPENFAPLFAALEVPARVIVFAAPTPHGGGFSWFDSSPGGDPAAKARGIESAAALVATAIGDAAARRPTAGRPIVTGFSQGGMLSFALAALHPEAVDAAFPLSGWLPPSLVPEHKDPGKTYPPIVALHGDADQRLEIQPTRVSVASLNAHGIPAELREFPGVGHTVAPGERVVLKKLLEDALRKESLP